MSLKNNIIKFMTKKIIGKKNDEQMIELIKSGGEKTEYNSEGFRIVKKDIPSKYEFSQKKYSNLIIEEMFLKDKVDKKDKKAVLFFHGGGYLAKLTDIYTPFMMRFCDAYEEATIISIEYTTIQDAPFPAAYNDAITAWNYVTSLGYKPENIIIAGDSAGGGLGLALTLYLRDNDIAIKAYIGMSPWVTLNCTSECFTNLEKKKTDPLFGSSNVIENVAKMYIDKGDVNDWRISPLNGLFDNMPKMFITYGTEEILRDDIQELYDRASLKTDVVLKVYDKCQHDIQTSSAPEAAKAWNDIKEYIRTLN